MKKDDIKIGHVYLVRVSHRLCPVTVIYESPVGGGWLGRNNDTGRDVRIKSAQRFRNEVARSIEATRAAEAPRAAARRSFSASQIVPTYDARKAEHPDKLLLFRIGAFYETFRGDAETLQRICGCRTIVLSGSIKTSGFEYHALESRLRMLTDANIQVTLFFR